MIAFLEGRLEYKTYENVIINVNGVGYSVFTSSHDYEYFGSVGDTIKLHTYMNVREDEMSLYGFLEHSDLKLFKLIINVNNLGPKKAIGIFSSISKDDFIDAILNEKLTVLKKINGVGDKTAKRMLLELKDRVEKEFKTHKLDKKIKTKSTKSNLNIVVDEAIQALTSLGYTKNESETVIEHIFDEIDEKSTVQDILKLALKEISTK